MQKCCNVINLQNWEFVLGSWLHFSLGTEKSAINFFLEFLFFLGNGKICENIPCFAGSSVHCKNVSFTLHSFTSLIYLGLNLMFTTSKLLTYSKENLLNNRYVKINEIIQQDF